MSPSNEQSQNLSIVSRFQAWHPFWSGELVFYKNGRFARPGIDEGNYEWSPERRITLKWDRWDPECLHWQTESKRYADPATGFQLRELPNMSHAGEGRPDAWTTLRPERLIVGAFSCKLPQYQERRRDCMRTWSSALQTLGVEVLFLVGAGDLVSEPAIVGPEIHGRLGDELWLPCPDDYQSLPQKTRWLCQWALESRSFDYLFKCDDDTYVVPNRLLTLQPGLDDYIGYDLTYDGWNHYGSYASGGAGYFLSRRAAACVATHVTARVGYEDVEVGQTLRRNGMHLRHDRRLIPVGDSHTKRPRPENDFVTSHACAEVWELHDSTWGSDPESFSGKPEQQSVEGIERVAFLVIATDRYVEFLDSLLAQAREHFFPDCDRTFFVYSEQPIEGEDIVWVEIEHRPWPEITLHKSHLLMQAESQLNGFDFLFLCDADMEIVGPIGAEVVGDLVAARHAGFVTKPRSQFTYETDPASEAAVSSDEGDTYYMASVQGGRPAAFLRAHRHMAERIDEDSRKGRIAIWQDESHWNRYLIDCPPDVALPSCYCWPANRHHQSPKIRSIDKNHSQVRRYEETFVTFSQFGNHGRLGNQLFQYALLLGVADHHRCEIAIPENSLTGFSLSAKQLKRSELSSFSSRYEEPGEPYAFYADVFNQPVGTDFLGYFQNYRYFESVAESVRNEFRFEEQVFERAQESFAEVRRAASGRDVVFLGVRRGDYVTSNGFHRPFELDYFDRAKSHFPDDVFFMVSSDDLHWARSNLTGPGFHFLDMGDPVMKLCVATMADHWICSASTYHWWAAWLGRGGDPVRSAKVVVPTPWYGPNYPGNPSADSMCPADWIRQP